MVLLLLPGLAAGALFGVILIRDWRGRFAERNSTAGRVLHLVARYGILAGSFGIVAGLAGEGMHYYFPGFAVGYFSILFLSAGKTG